MMAVKRSVVAFLCISVFTQCLGKIVCADEAGADDTTAKPPVVSSLPELPVAIHDAMQTRRFEDAVAAIDAELKKEGAKHAACLLYLKAVALTESKQFDNADKAYAAIENDHPKSQWLSRARFGRAHLHVLNRDYLQATKIYQKEAERLLSRNRKDELAAIYLEFADRYFEGVAADDPSKAKKPDYAQALTYYSEAVKLGPTPALREKVEFRIARCLEETNKHAEAVAAFERFLDDYSGEKPRADHRAKPEVIAEARYRKGSSQLAAKQPAEARRTWQNLLADHKQADSPNAVRDFLTKAQYRLAHTYGLPTPASVGDLELAVVFAEQFLKSNPAHKLAPAAELEIAQGYQKHNRHDSAESRLTALINNPKYADAAQIPVARRMLGQVYLAQQKFEEAITAWKAFLDNHPTDPQWPNVQKQIVDSEYARAAFARRSTKYDEARTLWQTFLNKYPLDARAASILYQFGQMKFAEAEQKQKDRISKAVEKGESAQSVKLNKAIQKLFEEAIADWRRVVQKYPSSNEASNASMMIGVTLEDQLGRLKEALDAYKKVSGTQQAAAKKRIAALTSPQLEIVTERKFRSDEKPRIRLTTRNVENVSVKVYRIDMTDYFRKMHLATGVENLDIALIDPDQQFDHAVKDFEEYHRLSGDVEIPTDGPGVTAVTVSSDKLEATTMVVVSDLDIIVKSSRNELFLFAENMRTGKAASGVSVLISDGAEVFAEEITGDDGTLQTSYDKLKSVNDLRIFAVQEGHVASTVNQLNGLNFAVGLSPRGYLYTDRPAYRAGQLVNIKGIVRWVSQDQFTFKTGEKFRLDIYDARGRTVRSEEVTLNKFGTINRNVILPDTAPQGQYRICLHRSSKGGADTVGELSFETHFSVSEYRVESVRVKVDIDNDVFFRGDKVEGTIGLAYYYGSPLAGEQIKYSFGPNGEQVTATTDEKGEVKVSFETRRFSESQPLTLTVQYPQRNLTAAKTVYLATRGFEVEVASKRNVYIAGETFDVTFAVSSPSGKPVGTDLKIEVFEQTRVNRVTGEKLVQSHEVKAAGNSGEARQTLQLDKGGFYIVRATGTDQFGNSVSGQKIIRISGDKDSVQLRILADKHAWDVGESAKVKVHWRGKPALALVTFEGASILGHQLVSLKKGSNTVTVPMSSELAPNFLLSIAVMERNEFHTAASPFTVAQKLRVTLKPDQTTLKPGENLNVAIEVTDTQGNPVEAELSLGLVQTNLLNMFGEVQGAIDTFFSKGSRSPSLRQTTSCTFAYRPRTNGISEFLLAEMERRNRIENESLAISRLGELGAWAFADDNADAGVAGRRFSGSSGPLPMELSDEMFGELLNGENVTRQLHENGQRDLARPAPSAGHYVVDSFEDQQIWMKERTLSGPGQAGGAGYAGIADKSRSRGSVRMFRKLQAQPNLAFGIATAGDQVSGKSTLGLPLPQRSAGRWQRNMDRFLVDPQMLQQNDFTINGLTTRGALVALNGRDAGEVRSLIENDGLQLLPGSVQSETGFWDPLVVSDKDGKASVVLTMPSKSTAWQLRTKGINGESLAGEATAEVITKKDLFGEMKLPQAFVTGDKAVVPVEIHSSIDEQDMDVSVVLTTTFGDTSTRQKKTVKVNGAGVTKTAFEVEIPETEEASFQLGVTCDGSGDTSRKTVTVQPNGFPVFATASGTASQSTIAFVQFEADMKARKPSLEVVIGPSVNRSLLDTVLGGGGISLDRCGLPAGSSIERAVSDVLGGVALLKMIGNTRHADTPDAQALSGRITSAISQLVSAQRDDGSWSWNGDPTKGNANVYTTSRIMWVLSQARSSGFAVPGELVSKGTAWLKTAFSKSAATALDEQTVILHSLATGSSGDFALANRLYRERNRLKQSGMLHLSLALAQMNHKDMAKDVLSLVRLSTDVKTVHRNTERNQSIPWLHNSAELRALYFLALQKIDPNHVEVPKLAKWLMAARIGSRWPVEKVNGIAIAGLCQWHTRTKHLAEKYKLSVSVNGQDIETLEIDPAKDASRRIQIPLKALANTDQEQEVEFKLDGRGTFSYSAVLTGFVKAEDLKSTTGELAVSRTWQPAQRMLDGKTIPRGFGVVNGSYKSFTNPLTQLPVGERGEVTLQPRRHTDNGDYLILTETIPSGCTILDGSVKGAFERFEIEPGRIRFYIGNSRYPGDIHYTIIGYIPGSFKTPPAILRSFYDPSRIAVSQATSLIVLDNGAKSVDDYRLTPDELYHFGQRYLAKGDTENAHTHLSDLFNNWRLDSDKYKNVVQWLFKTSLAKNAHSDTVRYFEIIKEKFADVEVSFENILKVAKSYQEMSEYERSYLVYRATIQGNFERESQVTGFLNKRGEFLRSTQILEELFADYPAESYVATATYALAQEVYRRAPLAKDDARLKEQKVNRVHLITGAIHMLDHFLTAWPNDPAGDQAGFALSTALIDLDQYDAAIARCQKYAERFTDSRLLDSYWYIIGYSHFELENHDEALAMCKKVAEATFEVPETGGKRDAQNKWEAVYIMGQVYHSLGKAAQAIAEYTQVKERFADAAEAIRFFSRRDISVEEVQTIKPNDKKQIPLKFRNIAEAAVKVYRIDLMKFGLMQRNLDRITAINLAGIKPYHEETITLGDGKDFRDREHELTLPLKEEGAYLVVCRGDNLYASGLVLVSPLALNVQEDETSGRVRVTVKDTTKDAFLDDVDVKVIGVGNSDFQSGETDLRGLFVADDVKGTSTVIAMADNNRYAFFRGERSLQGFVDQKKLQEMQQNAAAAQPQEADAQQFQGKDALRLNILNQNGAFQEEQKANYSDLLDNNRSGIQSFEVDKAP